MRIFLAPMEGVVDYPMRMIMRSVGGIDYCVTEFVRVTDHVLPRRVFTRACPELLSPEIANSRCPTRLQLLGSNPEALAGNARKAARLGAPGIDLNFGCPAKTVNKNRGGACLLDDTPLIADIVSAVREAVPQAVPVTAKIRLGYEERDSYLRNAEAIAAAGANELAVHARSKSDGYRPPAYWDAITEIRAALSIPVIANGEIWSLEDFKRCAEVTQCQDFMLGRGLMAQPDLACAIRHWHQKTEYSAMPWPQIAALVYALFDSTRNRYPKKYLGNRVKQWLFYLQRQYPEAGRLFQAIKREKDELRLQRALLLEVDELAA